MLDVSPELSALFRTAAHVPLLARAHPAGAPLLGRSGIQSLLPHRGAFLLLDRVTQVDDETLTIACACELARAAALLEGHFPQRPVYPGVLQVEAIGQAGLCLTRLKAAAPGSSEPPMEFALTHILGATFLRAVDPAGELEVIARVLSDGLFTVTIGQCLQDETICSVAIVRGIERESET